MARGNYRQFVTQAASRLRGALLLQCRGLLGRLAHSKLAHVERLLRDRGIRLQGSDEAKI
ncbi:MAG TPA: hypothetical protein DEV93_06765 [Chloroflexi bacterium]|nr:hypothetical protein [Chloroflexota bacterium]